MRRSKLLVLMLAVLIASVAVGCDKYRRPSSCTNWRYTSADSPPANSLPAELPQGESAWRLSALRDDDPALRSSLQDHCGQIGPAVTLAWRLTKGRDDVRIAVLDSGILWRSPTAMADLARNAYINVGEARPPGSPPSGDANNDGRFDIADFGSIADLNGNGVADPEDLILSPTYSNGIDDDGNGYVDDISGWDFLYGDNDPLDTVSYAHGTGEAKNSNAAANGSGEVGTCPTCRFIPVRVGDSFLTDGGRFAAGILFGLDSGADIIQEALGVTTNPPQAQQAIDAAYARGVLVVASMADEASKHANLPAALERTMPVNSITKRTHLAGGQDGWMALNGCTNWGPNIWVSVPSAGCSSEATGLAAGMAGLIESAARDGGVPRHPDNPTTAGSNVLSATELKQLVRANADDIDYSTATATEPANNFTRRCNGCNDLVSTRSYPSRKGWDQVHGFGRINAYESVRLARAKKIPPEAEITSPTWFTLRGTTGSMTIKGRVAARFASSYSYRVEWTVGANPPQSPATDTWHTVGSGNGLTSPRSGTLATVNLASIAAKLPGGGSGTPVTGDATHKPDEDRFAVRVRVVVTAKGGASDGLRGVDQRGISVHRDPDLYSGYPRPVAGASSTSPVFANLDGGAGSDLIVATSDGLVHAYKPGGGEAPGWPVSTVPSPWWPTWSQTAASAGIAPVKGAITIGAPAVADIDNDGSKEVVVTDIDGNVWAWTQTGAPVAGFGPVTVSGQVRSNVRVNPAYSVDDPAQKDKFNRTKLGFFSSPALGQLDADPQLEIVAGALDRHVYAWNHDGTPVNGWPVMVVDPAKVAAVDSQSHKVTFNDATVRPGGEIVAAPTLVDLTNDGRDEVIIGAQEQYRETVNAGDSSMANLTVPGNESGNARIYQLDPRGTAAGLPDRNPAFADDSAMVAGWPVKIGMPLLDTFPMIGDGISAQAAVADVKPSLPGQEIIVNAAAGPVYVLRADGSSAYGANAQNQRYNPALWAGGLGGEQNGRFGSARKSTDIVVAVAAFSGPSAGRIDGDATPDFTGTTAGYTRLLDMAGPELQMPSDDQVMAWKGGDSGDALSGFPQVSTDIGFFVTPAIADLDGDGNRETIAPSSTAVVSAFEANGSRPSGWPKLHGGWVVGTPGFGDFDGDGTAEVAVVRRDGQVFVWHTSQGASALDQWPRFGGNSRNSGVAGGN